MSGIYTDSTEGRSSADRDAPRVPAPGPVRRGRADQVGLGLARPVGGTDLERVLPGRGGPVQHPLDPGRVRDRLRQLRLVPRPVDAYLDLADPAVGCPGDPRY